MKTLHIAKSLTVYLYYRINVNNNYQVYSTDKNFTLWLNYFMYGCMYVL